ncbi:MAG: ATP-binding protein, partial [Bacteroidota bacterium]
FKEANRLFKNIIDNSVTYRGEKPPEINISHTLDVEKKQHIFAFEDNGAGIKREDYDKIFMIFQKDSETDQNIGMGLAISKKIALNHNGRLWFTSNVGKGTTFYLSLPCTAEERCQETGIPLSEVEKDQKIVSLTGNGVPKAKEAKLNEERAD